MPCTSSSQDEMPNALSARRLGCSGRSWRLRHPRSRSMGCPRSSGSFGGPGRTGSAGSSRARNEIGIVRLRQLGTTRWTFLIIFPTCDTALGAAALLLNCCWSKTHIGFPPHSRDGQISSMTGLPPERSCIRERRNCTFGPSPKCERAQTSALLPTGEQGIGVKIGSKAWNRYRIDVGKLPLQKDFILIPQVRSRSRTHFTTHVMAVQHLIK